MEAIFMQPWPWYVGGPLIGLIVPFLLIVGGKSFGFSANLRHICAATAPGRSDFLRYDWKRAGLWNLVFTLGLMVGAFIAARFLAGPGAGAGVAEATKADLRALGIREFAGFVPSEIFSWSSLRAPANLLIIVGGGVLVGFGSRWAGGCTSGHAITGLSSRQVPSLVAVLGFFVGGLIGTHLLLPILL